jgi:anthranilate phosphoribosyltransferase
MNETIDRVLTGSDLTLSQAENAFRVMFRDEPSRNKFGSSLLCLLQKKGEHSNELTGLVQSVRKMEKKISNQRLPYLVDGCGTGGDSAKTINISTLACIVAAGAGAQVAKHGNRSITSQCGSADLLEKLGVQIEAPKKRMLKALQKCGIGYFHAPLYHPIFRLMQPTRQALAKKRIKTIFNLVGPLLNPLRPVKQTMGVFRKDLVFVMAETLKKLKFKHTFIFWNYEGLDELTTSAKSFVIEQSNNKLRPFTLDPTKLGFARTDRKDLNGGNIQYNSRIAKQLLSRRDCNASRRDTVILNAAFIIWASEKATSLKEAVNLASKSLKQRFALNALKQLVQFSHGS